MSLTTVIDDPTYAEIQRWRRAMRRRLKHRPETFRFWQKEMADAEHRNCTYCGRLFQPNLARPCDIPGAPVSVVLYQQRAFCSSICASVGGYNTKDDGRGIRIKRTQIEAVNRAALFEKDEWRCYLCGRKTLKGLLPGDGRIPTLDHVVPLVANGTESSDNLRCACNRCNTEKGTSTIWRKIKIVIAPFVTENVLQLLPRPLTLDDLIQLWRYYYFDGDAERVRWWNKPPHPLIEPIARVYPMPPPVNLIKSLRIYAADDTPDQIIVETEYADGCKTIERRDLPGLKRAGD